MIETQDVVALRVPAQARYVRVARLVGAGLANDIGADLESLDDVRLAIGEACALVVQSGAEFVDLQFRVADGTLEVSGEAHGDGVPDTDAEHVSLVDQILRVACSDHRITRDGNGLSFSLTFTHGS